MRIGSILVAVALLSIHATAQHHESEAPLEPGPFQPIAGARLGPAVEFENEIDSHVCHALIVEGRTVAWVFRAYEFSDQLLLRRCTRYTSLDPDRPGHVSGGVNDQWETVQIDSPGKIRFLRFFIPLMTGFSRPVFCGALVSYWAFQGDALVPAVYNLTTRAFVASYSLGTMGLETDDTGFLPDPAWNTSCSSVTFDGPPVSRSQIRLVLQK